MISTALQGVGWAFHALGWLFYFTGNLNGALICFGLSLGATLGYFATRRLGQ